MYKLLVGAAILWLIAKSYSNEQSSIQNTIVRLFPADFVVDSHAALKDPEVAEISKIVPPAWIVQIVEEEKTKGTTESEVFARLQAVRDFIVSEIKVSKDKVASQDLANAIKTKALAVGVAC